MSSKQQQIVGLQDLIDSLTGLKLSLQEQTGQSSFSEVMTSYSTEVSSGQGRQGTNAKPREQLRRIRSSFDKLVSTLDN